MKPKKVENDKTELVARLHRALAWRNLFCKRLLEIGDPLAPQLVELMKQGKMPPEEPWNEVKDDSLKKLYRPITDNKHDFGPS